MGGALLAYLGVKGRGYLKKRREVADNDETRLDEVIISDPMENKRTNKTKDMKMLKNEDKNHQNSDHGNGCCALKYKQEVSKQRCQDKNATDEKETTQPSPSTCSCSGCKWVPLTHLPFYPNQNDSKLDSKASRRKQRQRSNKKKKN